MTQQRNSSPRSSRIHRRSLFMQGLGWLGGISLLSSGSVVFAQAAPEAEAIVVPTAQDLLAPVEQSTPPASVAPQPASVPAPAPDPIAAPERIAPEPSPVQAAEPANDNPSAVSNSSETTPRSAATPAPQTPALEAGGQYIDSTDYSIGATRVYDRPAAIVFSERSTGCQAVVSQGVPSALCTPSGNAGAVTTATGGRSGSGVNGRSMGNVSSVSVGAISLGRNGIGIARNHFNLTPRPSGRAGNGNLNLMFPLSIPVAITSAFGWRIHPISGTPRFHYGTDLGAPMGTPVLAAYTGRVSVADFMGGYGLTVVMQHANNTQETLYAHLSEIYVQAGEVVQQGQVIGRVGSTGNSTGPHLHFEFRERTADGWVAMNPGMLLETALAKFVGSFQTVEAQAPSDETKPETKEWLTKTRKLMEDVATDIVKLYPTVKFEPQSQFNRASLDPQFQRDRFQESQSRDFGL